MIVVVADNRAVDELLPVTRSLGALTGAVSPDAVIGLLGYDVLPFENLSPHPEIQEARATALWKIATRAASIVLTPLAATAMRLRDAEFYADLARVVRRGEMVDPERLVEHLRIVGYNQVDVVEMPGEFAHRGGLLDVYSPEMDRPVRIELFGDEVESIRKFDPGTQRSAAVTEEAVLLPLTETPVEEETLAAINARLSGARLAGDEHVIEESVRATGVAVFPGWELYAPAAAKKENFFDDLLPGATIVLDEPDALKMTHDAWWAKVIDAHERSLVGNLVRPQDLYLTPELWHERLQYAATIAVEQLGIENGNDEEHLTLQTQPTTRFHGSVAAMTEEVSRLAREGKRVIFAVSSTGEVERLADVFKEYNLSFRIGSRTPKPGSEVYVDESSYFAEDVEATTIVKAYVPEGVALPEANLVLFGARDLFDEPEVSLAYPQRQKSKVSAFLSDFRDLAVGDYVVHVEHGIGQYQGLKEIPQEDGGTAEFMILEYAEGARLYVPLTRLDLVQKYRSSEGVKPVLNRLGTQQWQKTKARVKKAMQDMAEELLKLYAIRKSAEGHAFAADSEWQREFEDSFEFSETEDQMNAIVDVKHDMESATPIGPPALRRCGVRQDRSRDAGCLQSSQRQSAGRCLGANHSAGLPALQHVPAALGGLSHQDRHAQPLPYYQTAEGNHCEDRVGRGGHRYRHSSCAVEGRKVQRSRAGHRGRRTTLCSPQGAAEAASQRGGCGHHVGHAHSAHLAYVAAGAARHERYRDAAQGSHGDPDGSGCVGSEAFAFRDRERVGSRRPGVLCAQSRGKQFTRSRTNPRDGTAGAHPCRPRPSAGARTGEHYTRLHAARSRKHPGRDHDH